jgi:hypothetical protein
MSLEQDETRKDLEHRHADDSSALGSTGFIQANIDADFALLGNIVTDLGDLPGDANPRGAGIWTDPKGAQTYLDDGGSLLHYESDGTPTPSGLVYFYRFEDEFTGEIFWEVYIKDESE